MFLINQSISKDLFVKDYLRKPVQFSNINTHKNKTWLFSDLLLTFNEYKNIKFLFFVLQILVNIRDNNIRETRFQ